jgi:hypothetical protein
MHVDYQGTGGKRIVYLCNMRQIPYGAHACQRMPGAAVDAYVTGCVLAALAPAQLTLSLAVLDEMERQQAELSGQWQRRLEAAQYTASLAQRRYEQVDPQNRLVARTLEQAWEAALREVDRVANEIAALQRRQPQLLSAAQRQALAALGSDLERVWFAPTTSWAQRKDLLRLLIADVTLTRHETGITVKIRWLTNQIASGELPLPIANHGVPTPPVIVERLSALYRTQTDQEIADCLNQDGLKTAQGNVFTAKIVERTRQRHKLFRRPPPND